MEQGTETGRDGAERDEEIEDRDDSVRFGYSTYFKVLVRSTSPLSLGLGWTDDEVNPDDRNEEYLRKHGISYPSNLDWLLSPSPSSTATSRSSRPRRTSTPSTPENDGEEEEQDGNVDHGELNLALQDEDFASSAPKDLPPIKLS
jgi:hypothetical protein